MQLVIDNAAKKYAGLNTEIISTQPETGPESIEGYYDEVGKRRAPLSSC